MNKTHNSSGTFLFLMEMITVVFFFILCASICILTFVEANELSRLANDTNRGVVGAESIAEVWKAEGTEGLTERMLAVCDSVPAETYRIFWDAEWKVTAEAETAPYQSEILLRNLGTDGLEEVRITVERVRDGARLFELQTKRYVKSQK